MLKLKLTLLSRSNNSSSSKLPSVTSRTVSLAAFSHQPPHHLLSAVPPTAFPILAVM